MQETISDQIIQAYFSGRRNMQLEQLANTAPRLLSAVRQARNHIAVLDKSRSDASYANIALLDNVSRDAEKQVAS